MTQTIISMNGTLSTDGSASLPVLDHAVLYGDGLFDTVVAHQGAIFKLAEHLDRCYRGMRVLRLDLPVPRDTLVEWIQAATDACRSEYVYTKWIVTRGSNGTPLMDPRGCRPNVVVLARPYPRRDYGEGAGVALKTVAIRRPPSIVADARIKSLNYLNLVLAKLEAQSAGADEALLLDTDGHVCEAPGFNVFAIRGDQLATPRSCVLAGVTRAVVLAMAGEHGLSPAVTDLELYDLYTADEVFLTSTAGGVLPVSTVDGIGIGTDPGPRTKALADAYWGMVRGAVPR